MNAGELEQCYTVLGVQPGISLEELERAFMKRNFALLKGKSGSADEAKPELEMQRQKLRLAYEQLSEHMRKQQREVAAVAPPLGRAPTQELGRLLVPPVVKPYDPSEHEFPPFAFGNWKVNTFVPPLLLGFVWLVNLSPLKFMLAGFHVWMHEFGHSTAAWLTGRRATPLPIGWSSIEPDQSNFVYFGLLLLFVILFVVGWQERKIWAMVVAVAAAGLQFYLTWRMPEHRQEFWYGSFCGVGGEFYLSTLFMMSFWVQLPEKFKWGACRYVFFFIGATAFLNIWIFWIDVYHGVEEIPFGSMINGEDDQGGDMNKLMDGYGWTKFQIRRTYYLLGQACWVALGVTWAVFALRLNKIADWVVGKFASGAESEEQKT